MEQKQELRSHTYERVDEIDRARAQEYALPTTLLSQSPDSELLGRLALLRGDTSPLGVAHAKLGEAASRMDEESVRREYFTLFIGLGSGLLALCVALFNGRPLARLRDALQQFGIEKAAGRSEPEDHAAILCEIMAGLVEGGIAASPGADREFFEKHLAPWIRRFFVDLERAGSADFYARVGSLGRIFIEVEPEAFTLPASTPNGFQKTGEDVMRVFIVACLLAGVIAVGAAAILDNFVQESSSVAFAEPGTRI